MKTPELDKILKIADQTQAIGDFLEWIRGKKGWDIVRFGEGTDHAHLVNVSVEQMLADFYGINLDKAEEERRALLAELTE